MATQQKLSTKLAHRRAFSGRLDRPRGGLGGLGIIIQTIYDLRSQGQGPRGFRVGRELRFRVSEIDSWLAQMEADDADRHPQAYR